MTIFATMWLQFLVGSLLYNLFFFNYVIAIDNCFRHRCPYSSSYIWCNCIPFMFLFFCAENKFCDFSFRIQLLLFIWQSCLAFPKSHLLAIIYGRFERWLIVWNTNQESAIFPLIMTVFCIDAYADPSIYNVIAFSIVFFLLSTDNKFCDIFFRI